MLAGPKVVERVKQLQVTWGVSSVAQAAGIDALRNGDRHVERGRETVMRAKRYLESELDAAGVVAVPSTANFLPAKVGDATAVRTALLTRGICVRDCSSFGLPSHIRIGPRDMEDCRKLVVALREVLAVA